MISEREHRHHVAQVLRSLRRQRRGLGGSSGVTIGLLREWRRQADVLQAFRRADARTGGWR